MKEMTKKELLQRYENALQNAGMTRIDGIGPNSRKQDIQNAITCMETSPETMNDYLTVIKLAYPSTYKTITEGGRDWLHHYFNRYFVFCNARMIINGGLIK